MDMDWAKGGTKIPPKHWCFTLQSEDFRSVGIFIDKTGTVLHYIKLH